MTSDDRDRAAALDRARAVLERAGAGDLERRPWQHPHRPVADGELVRFAVWAARAAVGTDPAVVAAGLRLLAAARAELDAVEAGLLFSARGAGLTWPQVAEALGLASAQAAQQRGARVQNRAGTAGRRS